MTAAVVQLISDHDRRLPEQRVEWIGDLYLARQTPGIMRSRGRRGETLADAITLVETAELSDLDPEAWLADVLARISEHLISLLHELLPWNWTRGLAEAVRAV